MERKLTLNQKEVVGYGAKNAYALSMFGGSAEDYISSRCLILNRLFTGFPLYPQSIEKFLKALIFLEKEKKPHLDKLNQHNPDKLKLQLQKDYDLKRFDNLLKRLHGHFQTRYYDNPDRSDRMSGAELDEFDELWMHLFDIVPFPIEIKYRLQFPALILDERYLKYWPGWRHWATINNKFLTPEKINQMDEIYLAINQHLFGDRNPKKV